MTTEMPEPGEPVQYHQGGSVSPALAVAHVGEGLRLWVFPADGSQPRLVTGVPHRDWALSAIGANPDAAPLEMGFWDWVHVRQP